MLGYCSVKIFLLYTCMYIHAFQYPTRLLLQMPRYGKRFKSFQRIVPSLELDVTQLCMTREFIGSCLP